MGLGLELGSEARYRQCRRRAAVAARVQLFELAR